MRQRVRHNCIPIVGALFLLLLLGACAGAPAQAQPTPAPAVLTAASPPPKVEPGSVALAAGRGHPALMQNDGSGRFYPERTVTRRELCRDLAGLLKGLPTAEDGVFSDYFPGNADYAAAASLCAAGFLPLEEEEAFRPAETASAGELAYILERLEAVLPAADRPGAEAALKTLRQRAGESEPLTRRTMAAVLECLTGREPDEAALFLRELLPGDVTREDPDWALIADAVTEGPVKKMEPGVHRAWGWLYAVWEDGTLVKDMDYGVWTFGLEGDYTTGNEALDASLREGLEACGANGLTGEEALAAAYLYVKSVGEYLVRPEDMEPEEMGDMGWEYQRAARFFRYGGGTCYGYAAAFGLMARALGETAYIVAGEVNQFNGPHAFVVIPEDGTDWIYDVELEATRPERHGPLELFHIQNHTIYHYWYEPDWSDG